MAFASACTNVSRKFLFCIFRLSLIWLTVLTRENVTQVQEVRLSGPSNYQYEGGIEIIHNGQWGTLCRDGLRKEDGIVICRSLGFGQPPVLNVYDATSSSLPTLAYNLNCTGDEHRIEDCQTHWDTSTSCESNVRASIRCRANDGSAHAVRLYSANSALDGKVQIKYDGRWRDVCYDGWGIKQADVVCRQLGYTSADVAKASSGYSYGDRLSNFDCIGNETRIDLCKDWVLTRCSGDKAAVSCRPPASGNDIPVRLVNGSRPNEGRVEILDSGLWSTVCDVGWDKTDADVVCKQLGYPAAEETRSGAYFGPGTGQILLGYVACNSRSYDLRFCENTYHPSDLCSHDNDAGVVCEINVAEVPLVIRLTQATSAYEGLIEIERPTKYSGNEWTPICADNFGIDAASVACRELGYPSAESVKKISNEGDALSDFACRGDETRLEMCKSPGTWFEHRCHSNTSTGVRCRTSKDTMPVRLVNGTSANVGRVEILHGGEWGTVCSHGYGWGQSEADVVCHQLGYRRASEARSGAFFGAGTGTILLRNVYCRTPSTDYDLRFCSSGDWYPALRQKSCYGSWCVCTHMNDVGVECELGDRPYALRLLPAQARYTHLSPSPPMSAWSGTVQVNHFGSWSYICLTNSDNTTTITANLVCQQLGYLSAEEVQRNYARNTDSYYSYSYSCLQINCIGNETRLDMCGGWTLDNSYRYGSKDYYLGVSCQSPKHRGELPVRVVNGSKPHEGRVEILNSDKWSTVCDIGWNNTDADVVCKQLGYTGSKEARPGGYFGAGTGPILLSNLTCNPESLDLRFCDSTYLPGKECSHDNDAGVECIPAEKTPVRVFPLLLRGAASAYEGVVELRILGNWFSICTDHWNIDDANVVCQELGYPSAKRAVKSIASARYNTINIYTISCYGNETKLSMCEPPVSLRTQECASNTYRAGVVCRTYAEQRPVRLMDGHTRHEGRVEIFHGGEWTTICDTSSTWDKFEANIVCRQLGYKGAVRAQPGGYYGAGSGTILLSHVSCSRSNKDHQYDVRFCYNRWYPGAECTHANDVGVECDTADLSNPPTAMIAGIVVSCVLIIVIVITTILLIARCKKRSDSNTTTDTPSQDVAPPNPIPAPMAEGKEYVAVSNVSSSGTPQLMFLPEKIAYTRLNLSNSHDESQSNAPTNCAPPPYDEAI